ncbi:NADPH:quinone oxidoreductase family protein [Janibacter sp. YIM B02568]|uniref:NADPH:quinone oxidoreductase family protein n=1 Tax=Janibacter endophyticus TaxID=2806261 RepID=UPI0019509665|nr:NADPH:quinone oxidoreductase family protein [Janibacter endophyticus]MBM6545408.1 NADPH:quinone oxidoreductase family protein [Janibacter endophyticus]
MRAFVIQELTGPSAGAVHDVPEPEGAHEWAEGERLLIDVRTAGVAFPDVLQTRGEYQHGQEPPYVAGAEVAGTVLEAPSGSRFQVGDRVAGLTLWGALAERALALPQYTFRVPEAMSDESAAAFPLNYSTAWFACRRAAVTAGETVLVHGAAGGVGTAAIQALRALGASPIAVVSDDAKAEVARHMGATHVVRSDGTWVDQVKDLTDGLGVDVVIDPVGGDRFTDSLRSLDVGGRLAVVGFAAGEIPTVKVNRLLLRDLSVVGVALAPWIERHPDTAVRMAADLEAWASAGQVSPHVGLVVPLDEAVDALRAIDERRIMGKAVVRVKAPNSSPSRPDHHL